MKKYFFLAIATALCNVTNAQNVGIGTSNPPVMLSVDSSIMLDMSNSNPGNLSKGALLFGSDQKVGIYRTATIASGSRNGIAFNTNTFRRMVIDSVGRVGIGTSTPQQLLHVSGGAYIGGNLGIGSTTPDYGFENLWGYNYLYYNVGIGPGIVPTSSYILDVGGGPVRLQNDVRINGILNPNNVLNIGNNTTIEGTLTVNNGKGVAYNSTSATNLKIAPFTTANFHAVLGAHGSATTTIGLPGGFTSAPNVFVGNIAVTGGTVGELNRVILVLSNCSTSSCDAKIINTDNAAVDYNITWDCLAVGY